MPARVGVSERPGGVRVITLQHPARRNALDPGAIQALDEAVASAEKDGVRALVLRGEGQDAFCAGYDLTALAEVGPAGALPDDALEAALNRLAACPVPSIALVHGAAFGAGCDLACACDFRVGSDSAVFCMPPARLGVVYAASGIARVAAIIGAPRAKRMFLTAAKVRSDQALAWGLLDERGTTEEAETAAFDLADQVAALAPLAVRGMKRTFAAVAAGQGAAEALRELRRQAFASEDAREGKAAFLEKRSPRFRGE